MPTFSELFAVNVPRYTSYPTAPHFHSGIRGGFALNEEGRMRWQVIEDLMCNFEGDLEELARQPRPPSFADSMQRLAPLVSAEIVECDGFRIRVARKEVAVLRLTAATFDDYLPGKPRTASWFSVPDQCLDAKQIRFEDSANDQCC